MVPRNRKWSLKACVCVADCESIPGAKTMSTESLGIDSPFRQMRFNISHRGEIICALGKDKSVPADQ